MKVLITGASGFIASHIALGLSQKGHKIIALRHTNPCAEAVVRTCEIKQADLRQKDVTQALLKACAPDAIVHAAALTSTSVCEENPALAQDCNVAATEHIITAASELPGRPRLIYFSTDLVFENAAPSADGFAEEHSPQPVSVYAKTKLESEQMIAEYRGPNTILRSALTYGPPLGDKEGFLGWLRKGLVNGDTVPLFRDEWRTPVYTEDIIETVAALLTTAEAELPNLLHLGGAERINRFDFGLRYAEVFNFNPAPLQSASLTEATLSAPRAPDASLSITRLRQTLNIHPHNTKTALLHLKQTLTHSATLEHYRTTT